MVGNAVAMWSTVGRYVVGMRSVCGWYVGGNAIVMVCDVVGMVYHVVGMVYHVGMMYMM